MSKWKHTNGGIITAAPGSFRETLCKGSPDWQPADDADSITTDEGTAPTTTETPGEKPKRRRSPRETS